MSDATLLTPFERDLIAAAKEAADHAQQMIEAPPDWTAHMTPAEDARWTALRARAHALDAERRAITDETNRLRQRVQQRALYRRRASTDGRAA